jgi:hypothetical protein
MGLSRIFSTLNDHIVNNCSDFPYGNFPVLDGNIGFGCRDFFGHSKPIFFSQTM